MVHHLQYTILIFSILWKLSKNLLSICHNRRTSRESSPKEPVLMDFLHAHDGLPTNIRSFKLWKRSAPCEWELRLWIRPLKTCKINQWSYTFIVAERFPMESYDIVPVSMWTIITCSGDSCECWDWLRWWFVSSVLPDDPGFYWMNWVDFIGYLQSMNTNYTLFCVIPSLDFDPMTEPNADTSQLKSSKCVNTTISRMTLLRKAYLRTPEWLHSNWVIAHHVSLFNYLSPVQVWSEKQVFLRCFASFAWLCRLTSNS